MQTNEGVKVNRKHKDTLFRLLFGENKENALSLYNAVNGSSYTSTEDLEFTTLEDVIYMKMKNDVSFLFGKSLNLYEHQSSYNPNMPLRGLMYFADLYRQLIPESERLYGQTLVKIPTPKYIVFYNGSNEKMNLDRIELKLSDAFEMPDETHGFEWTATMININYGKNKEIMEKCKVLSDYSIFIAKIRQYNTHMKLKEAIDRAIKECISQDILRNVLSKHQREVMDMCLTEFDEKKYGEIVREEGREEGRILSLVELVKKGILDEKIAQQESGLSEEEFKKWLYQEV